MNPRHLLPVLTGLIAAGASADGASKALAPYLEARGDKL